ncbi:MAG: ATP-binding cassette domain-containing protein [bacterium]
MIVQLNNISFSYGNSLALDEVSLSIEAGAIGLLGPNGAGKTTLFKILLGFLKPNTGSGDIFGMDIVKDYMSIRQRIGYMPESDCYINGMSGVSFVAYMGQLCGMSRKDAIQRAHEVFQYVGMDEERYRMIETYSPGMKQKAKLAQALIHDPDLLLLDEPTIGLDPKSRQDMLELIKDISEDKNINIILSSHLLPEIEYTCNDVIVLSHGKVALQGKIQELKNAKKRMFEVKIKGDKHSFISALESKGCDWQELEDGIFRVSLSEGVEESMFFEIAYEKGLQIRQLIATKYSLEDIFVKAVKNGS